MRSFIRFLLPSMIFVSILLNACGAVPQAAPMPATPRLAIAQASPTVMVANMAAGGSNSALESPTALPSMTSLPTQPAILSAAMPGISGLGNPTDTPTPGTLNDLPLLTPKPTLELSNFNSRIGMPTICPPGGTPNPTSTPNLSKPTKTAKASSKPTKTPESSEESENPDSFDPLMNQLKNRINNADYYWPLQFQEFLKLPGPDRPDVTSTATLQINVDGINRAKWSSPTYAAAATQIALYEGIPVSVEGYITDISESKSESTNCGSTQKDMVDWHIYLKETPWDGTPDAKNQHGLDSIVVETTPRIRANHKWDRLLIQNEIAKKGLRVRISGWLFFDQEHQGNVTSGVRGTLWEIHPVMKIEVQQDGIWKDLDQCTLTVVAKNKTQLFCP